MSAARKSTGLGKGLGALIPGSDGEPVQRNIARGNSLMAIGQLIPNPDQPRKQFDEDKIEALAGSIKRHGLLQPIVAKKSSGGKYIIVAGERRFRASKKAGLKEVPVIVKNIEDEQVFELALIENIQREGLTPLEQAHGFVALIDAQGLTQKQAAERVGVSRSALTNKIRLLTLPAPVQLMVEDGSLSEGHARALLGLEDANAIERLARKVVQEQLNVRDVERMVRESETKVKEPKSPKPKDPNLRNLEQRLEHYLGAKVNLTANKQGKGKIVISYNSLDEFDAILSKLG